MSYPLSILINDFALRSLRETADKDYVYARLAYRFRLMPQFLWSSLHCLEKYTKCVLLLNRIDARKIKHEVSAGLNRLRTHGKFQIDLTDPSAHFVAELERGARFRYYEASYWTEGLDLPRLDRTVWELRRYCQPLDYELDVDGIAISQLAANLSRIRDAQAAHETGTCIVGGWLENVVKKKEHASREALVWQNLFFSRHRRQKVLIPSFEEAGNSPLFLHPEIVNEVARYIYLPNEVKKAYLELHEKRLKGASDV